MDKMNKPLAINELKGCKYALLDAWTCLIKYEKAVGWFPEVESETGLVEIHCDAQNALTETQKEVNLYIDYLQSIKVD